MHSCETGPSRSLSLSSHLHRPLSDLADRHSATYCTARTARTAPAPGKRWAAPGATGLAGGCSQGSHLATRRRHHTSVELRNHLKGLADRHSASHALYLSRARCEPSSLQLWNPAECHQMSERPDSPRRYSVGKRSPQRIGILCFTTVRSAAGAVLIMAISHSVHETRSFDRLSLRSFLH